jgi:hypothetical protein
MEFGHHWVMGKLVPDKVDKFPQLFFGNLRLICYRPIIKVFHHNCLLSQLYALFADNLRPPRFDLRSLIFCSSHKLIKVSDETPCLRASH